MKLLSILLIIAVLVLGSVDLKAQTYFLNGSAIELGGDCYRLTGELANQNGTVWYADQIDLTEPFDLEFLMNFGTLDWNGADGIVFVLQTVGTNAIGENGEGMGFQGFLPSLGVEFDTWQNANNADPFADHIALISNGQVNHNANTNLAGPVNASALSDNIEDGQDHIVRIVWDPEVQDIEIWFDCELRLIHGVDIVEDIFNGQELVWWGFTAATGGSWNNQTVCLQDNIISVGPNVTICNGASTTLVVAGNPEGTYEWSPAAGLNDPNSQTPIASPTETTTYTVTYTDFCGNQRQDEVTVEVTELEVNATVNGIITCNTPELTLVAGNNFSNAVFYAWETFDGSIDSGQNTATPVVSAGGTYTVTATYQNACFDSFDLVVEENLLSYSAEILPAPDVDCNNPEVQLQGITDGPNAVFNWNSLDGSILSGANTEDALVNDGGTYTFTVTNPDNGCSSASEIQLNNNIFYPLAEAGPADTLECLDPLVVLDGSLSSTGDEFSYFWSSSDGLMPAEQANLIAPQVGEPGVYYLTVSNSFNGCSSQDSVIVFFDESSLVDPDAIVFPNVFTPNNDGINEHFKPFMPLLPDFDLSPLFGEYQLRIFNRWGNLVFETSGNQKFWEGDNPNGTPIAEGVYFYTVDFTIICGEEVRKQLSGNVQLLR